MARDPVRKLLRRFKEIDGLICQWDESAEKLPLDPQIAAMLNVLREAREKLAELLKSMGIPPPYKKKRRTVTQQSGDSDQDNRRIG